MNEIPKLAPHGGCNWKGCPECFPQTYKEFLADSATVNKPVIEYATRFKGGDMNVFNSHPEVEKIYPMERRLANHRRHGAKIYRRVITVVEDWEEVKYDDE